MWKGRLFQAVHPQETQQICNKTFFVHCDCKTCYILCFCLHRQWNADLDVVRKLVNAGAVAHSLLSPSHLEKEHILFVDNWYTSPLLFRHLHKCNTSTCGTVQLNWLYMPKFMKKLKCGQTGCYRKNVVGIKMAW